MKEMVRGRPKLDMDKLVISLVTSSDIVLKERLGKKIKDIAYKQGVYSSSINDLYMAAGRGEFSGFTVPAINLRGLTYDLARAIFRVAKRNNSGTFIFEIAKSEMGYTDQSPLEYVSVILGAAVREEYSGPVFIQADHTQVNPKKYKENSENELEGLKKLIQEAIDAGFYNIDIDSSTLVDLTKGSIEKEQELNFEVCAKLTQFIRQIEPKGITVSVGGEIGEVGKANSTPEELRAFMNGYKERLRKGRIGISKISVQTGTSHGGVVLPDGTIAQVKLDFDTLKTLSKISREEFGLGGAVQHGASTLPDDAFGKFPEVGTLEVHLATQFQNMVFDSPNFPVDLKNKIYAWLKEACSSERKPDQTDEQFYYSTRKKAFGQFKKEIMNLDSAIRDKIAGEVEEKFDFLFKKLNVINTKDLVSKYIKVKRVISRLRKGPAEVVERDAEGAD
ncbi:MAG: class II fructose-bisphosphate aldolase [Candidatus Omnitrophota bacterium]